MRFEQNFILKLMLLALTFSIFSCETEEYPVFLDNGIETSLGEVKSLEIRSGNNRVMIKGVVEDPDVSEVKIFWNDRSESVVVPVDNSTGVDTIQQMITGLEERLYVFEVQTFDAEGNASEVVSAGAEVFGANFAVRAGNRQVLSNVLRDSLLNVTFATANMSSGMVGTEFIYENTSGENEELFLGPEQNSLSISDFKSGSTFSYRSLFVPSLMALDSIYTEYDEVTPVALKEIVVVTDDDLDDAQIQWLEDQGFYVTTYYNSSFATAPQADIDMLNAADLVIIGRSGNSGDFDGDEKTAWNALTVPIILNSQWAARDNRLNWFDNDGNPDSYASEGAVIRAHIQEPGDVAFEGVTIGDDNLLPWLNAPVNLLYVSTPPNGNTIAVGAPGDAESEEGGAMLFVRFDTGIEFYEGAVDAPAGPRTYFGFGADEGGTSYYWQLTDEAKQVYLNEINRMME